MNSNVRPENPYQINDPKHKNVDKYLHDLFEKKMDDGVLSFQPFDWTNWSQAEIAGAVREKVKDFYESEGRGFDWISAAAEAERIIACHFYSLVVAANLSQEPLMSINFMEPSFGEGLIFSMMRDTTMDEISTLKELDPIPGVLQFPIKEKEVNTRSVRGVANLMLGPTEDALTISDRAIYEGVSQVGKFYSQNDLNAILYMAAFLTMWKSLQVAHRVRAEAIYRNIHNPNDSTFPVGKVRMTYHRGGFSTQSIIEANPSEMVVQLPE